MPIEIRELVIRARIDPENEQPTTPSVQRPTTEHDEQQDVVQACVREVLRILQDKRER